MTIVWSKPSLLIFKAAEMTNPISEFLNQGECNWCNGSESWLIGHFLGERKIPAKKTGVIFASVIHELCFAYSWQRQLLINSCLCSWIILNKDPNFSLDGASLIMLVSCPPLGWWHQCSQAAYPSLKVPWLANKSTFPLPLTYLFQLPLTVTAEFIT
jgi:hypothetical protein